ncbi:MAG: hypothetical protein WAL45_17525 [Terracidiphilus sp.]
MNFEQRVDDYVNRVRIGPLRPADIESYKQSRVEAMNQADRIVIEAGK